MAGTLRTTSEAARTNAHDGIRRIATNIAAAHLCDELGGIAKGLDLGEVTLQEQAGGLKDVLIVVHHEDTGSERRCDQVSVRMRTGVRAILYEFGQTESI